MTRTPRVALSFFLSLVLFVLVIHFMNIPLDRVIPPPMAYSHCVGVSRGVVTNKELKGYGDHVMEGDGNFYYVDYTYHAVHHYLDAKGRTTVEVDPMVYKGSVRVDEQTYNGVTIGAPVNVMFDPDNPAISGVKDTLGQWSTNTGYFNPYLWWYFGIIVLTYLIQEIIRIATKTADD